MAGYRVESPTYNLKFEGLEGLEVNIKGLNTGQMMELWEDKSDSSTSESSKETLLRFSAALISWNIEDENGVPIPATLEGIKSLDVSFVLTMVNGWTTALSGVDTDLGKDSDSGEQFQEASIPMETS